MKKFFMGCTSSKALGKPSNAKPIFEKVARQPISAAPTSRGQSADSESSTVAAPKVPGAFDEEVIKALVDVDTEYQKRLDTQFRAIIRDVIQRR